MITSIVKCGLKSPFPNFNRWNLGMDKYFHRRLHWACNYLCMMGLKWYIFLYNMHLSINYNISPHNTNGSTAMISILTEYD